MSTSQVSDHQTLGLCGGELRPRRPQPAQRRLNAMALQDRPNTRRANHDAYSGELTVDAAVVPGRVLLRQLEYQCGGSLGDERSTRAAAGIGSALGGEIAVPAAAEFPPGRRGARGAGGGAGQNARYSNESAIGRCSPRSAPAVKVQFTVHG